MKINSDRRRLLKAGLSATLFAPQPFAWVWAQSDGALKLMRAPKVALVIGNSNYKSQPLKNPANDARAISATLKATGFDVTTRLDTPHGELVKAVQAYTQTLAQRQAVGLFYFAGHGLQLAWRNYMVPVDANIRNAADIQAQCAELGELLAGIAKARNPLNVIILDACRDNPFGNLSGVDQRGLSQMDAPPSTLLAYATAPGNVASDGDGANGLYTEHLLKEIGVPEAKVEDVFKRVRLHVRRRTNGQQIPWESTSLEEDFFFVPPKELKRLSEAEAEREFAVEQALWDKIESLGDPKLLEDYLMRYPSGKFSEVAQLQLDRALVVQGEKKIAVVSDTKNPYTKGSAVTDTRFKVGDSYTYRRSDMLTKANEGAYTETITGITDFIVIYDSGLVTDLLGNRLRGRANVTGNQSMPLEFALGKRWSSRYVMPPGRGAAAGGGRGTASVEMDFRIVTRESVTVPAGTFNAYHIRGFGRSPSQSGRNMLETTVNVWHAPGQVRRPVIVEHFRRTGREISRSNREELVAFKES